MRKLKVLVAMIAMVLLAASPAMAQQIEFVAGGVLVVVEGTGSLEQPPVTGAVGVPDFGGGAVAGGDAFTFADPVFDEAFAVAGEQTFTGETTFAAAGSEFGSGAGAGETTFAGAAPEFGSGAQAGDICIDTTGEDFCL